MSAKNGHEIVLRSERNETGTKVKILQGGCQLGVADGSEMTGDEFNRIRRPGLVYYVNPPDDWRRRASLTL